MSLVLILELLTILLAVVLYIVMVKQGYKKVWKHFAIMFLAILLFMLMSLPMYRNPGLHAWAYLIQDLPWTLVLGWTDIFLASIVIVNKVWAKYQEITKFWLYLIVVTIITLPVESILLKMGIREYSSILTNTFSGIMFPLIQIPIEVLLAIPILATLIIAFYKNFSD